MTSLLLISPMILSLLAMGAWLHRVWMRCWLRSRFTELSRAGDERAWRYYFVEREMPSGKALEPVRAATGTHSMRAFFGDHTMKVMGNFFNKHKIQIQHEHANDRQSN